MSKSVILIGGPDTGKTNFLARLVAHLRDGAGALRATKLPEDIRYIEDALAHLMKGEFAPRSHNTTEELSGDVTIEVRHDLSGGEATISVPDVSGETWDDIAKSAEISQSWLDRVKQANGALLFVRVLSDLNVTPIDWVNAPKLLALAGPNPDFALPTQVMLCEFLRLLEEYLAQSDGAQARVGVILTAYDRLDAETRANGPMAFLEKNYPLFAGKLANTTRVEIGVFGLSVVGGELADHTFRDEYLNGEFVESGYIVDETKTPSEQVNDISCPVSWVMKFPSTA